MQNNNDTESRIKALKAQIALVKQDRENIHRTIQDRNDRARLLVPSRSYAKIIALPTLAIIGVLGGILIAKVHADTLRTNAIDSTPIYQSDFDDSLKPEAGTPNTNLEPSPPTVEAVAPSKPVPKSNTRLGPKVGHKKTPKGGAVKSPRPPKDPGDLDFGDCGDDPMCGQQLGK